MDNEDKKQDQNIILKKIITPLLTKIKALTWQDWTAIGIIFLTFLFYLNFAASFKQIPSPVFGGDYYRDRGFVKNIVEGNPIWSDGFYANEIQYYPYLIFALQAGIVIITGLSVNTIFLHFPLLTIILSGIVWYNLGNSIFKNKIWGIITLSSMYAINYYYGFKSSDFGLFVMVPLFLYFWIKYEQTNIKRIGIYAGITLGLIALIHGGRFLGAFSLILISILIFFITDLLKTKGKTEQINLFQNYFLKYYYIFLIAIIISLIFFLPLYLNYNMHSVNNVTIWGDANINNLGLSWIWILFKTIFLNTTNIPLLAASIISLIGFITLLIIPKNLEQKFILTLAIANIIALEHHLLTRLILDMYFNPGKLELITAFAPLFFTFGVIVLHKKIEKIFNRKIIAIIVLLLILLPCFYVRFEDYNNDQWIRSGQQENEYINQLYTLSDYITQHVNKDETILSNDESGFMLAMLSGRKVMLTRRTHASYYVDIDQRIAEASIAMYGSNLNQSLEIINKYQIKYFYIDQNLLTYNMRVRTDLKEYLIQNNINFTQVYDRYDIALPLEDTNGMDLLIIPPQQINPEFLKLWDKVYQVKVGNQLISELYQLKE